MYFIGGFFIMMGNTEKKIESNSVSCQREVSLGWGIKKPFHRKEWKGVRVKGGHNLLDRHVDFTSPILDGCEDGESAAVIFGLCLLR